MEENLPPAQVPVNPAPASAPPSPKRFPLNLILIILIITILFSTGVLFAVKNQSNKQSPPPTPTVQSSQISPSPTIDETSNWKTYTNTKYGYSIKSPIDWIVTGGDNGNISTIPGSDPRNINLILPAKPCSLTNIKNPYDCGVKDEIVVSVEDNPQNLSLKEFGNGYIGPGAEDEYKLITLDGVSGLTVGFGDNTTFVFLEKSSKVYVVEGSSSGIFSQILSTFKFLDNEEEFNKKFKEKRASARDIMRRADLTVLLSTIYLYSQDNQGNIPSKISGNVQFIKTGEADICSDLIPKYFPSMPQDPSISDLTKRFKNCSENYDTGYTVIKNPSTGKITLEAPFAEQDMISVTK